MQLLNAQSLNESQSMNPNHRNGEEDKLTNVPSSHYKGIQSVFNIAEQHDEAYQRQFGHNPGVNNVIDVSIATEKAFDYQ